VPKKGAVPADKLDELIRGMEAEDVDLGMFVTSGVFSEEFLNRAANLKVENGLAIEVVDGEQLATMIVDNPAAPARFAGSRESGGKAVGSRPCATNMPAHTQQEPESDDLVIVEPADTATRKQGHGDFACIFSGRGDVEKNSSPKLALPRITPGQE
jgi:hypothetical protein